MENVVNLQQLTTSYKGKKVFITGHTGFKGAWLTAWLQQLGAIVKGYALSPHQDESLYYLLSAAQPFDSVMGDIRDKKQFTSAILSFQPDYIFHLAAQPLVRKSYLVPAETFEVNVVGTANLLEAVNKLPGKCSIVIVTTDKVYENKEQEMFYTEEDLLGGYDPYSASKACTEMLTSSFRNSFFNLATIESHQKAIATARAGNVIGGGDYSEDRIFPDLIRSLQQESIIQIRNPRAVRPWQHVLEPLAGYLLLAIQLNEQPHKFSGAYNFGPRPTDHLSVEELVKTAIQHWGSGEWTKACKADQPHEAGLLKLDISKATRELSWSPRLSSTEAVEWAISWYKKDKKDVLAYSIDQIENYMQL